MIPQGLSVRFALKAIRFAVGFLALLIAGANPLYAQTSGQASAPELTKISFHDQPYLICLVLPATDDLRLFWQDDSGGLLNVKKEPFAAECLLF